MFLLGILIGIEIFQIFYFAVNSLISKMFGQTLVRFRIFSFEGKRTKKDQKLEWSKNNKFVPYPSAFYGKLDLQIHEDEERKTVYVILAVLGVVVMTYSAVICTMFWGVNNPSGKLFMGSAFGVIAFLVVFIYAVLNTTSKENKILLDRYDTAIRQLQDGATFEQLVLPLDGLDNPKIRDNVKCAYLNMCALKDIALRDYNHLSNIVRRLDACLLKMGNGSYTRDTMYYRFYYPIIFYSTYINPNYSNAIRFYNIIKDSLESDMDANGRRVLAYYQYYIVKRPDLAAVTLGQAEQALENFNGNPITQAEINTERILIEELRNNMTKALNPQEGYQPLISPDYI